MCGITGYFHSGPNLREFNKGIQESMQAIIHRGRDDGGYTFFDQDFHHFIPTDSPLTSLPPINTQSKDYMGGFGHRRLSVVDLSNAGHQPMVFNDLCITFNGEIYNYIELKEDLRKQGYQFITNSDTEVLLKSYHHWGKECLNHLEGMFAFVIYDKNKKKAFGARDRVGVKPFYYIHNQDSFSFASEQQALHYYPSFKNELNQQYLFDLFIFNEHERTKQSIYSCITELKAGEYFEYHPVNNQLFSSTYYQLKTGNHFSSEKDLRELLEDSVSKRMKTDVRIGTCLSGGMDSSILSGIMASRSDRKIFSFTAHYPNESIDEGKYAKAVVNMHQLDAHFVTPSIKELIIDYSEFISSLDLPIWSTSTYSQWRVMKLANQQNVKVVLDGQGADELFAGYTPHLLAYWRELLKAFRIITLINEVKKSNSSKFNPVLKEYFKLFYLHRLPNAWIKKILVKSRADLKYIDTHWMESNFEEALSRRAYSNASTLNEFLIKDLINGRLKTFLRCEDRCSMWHHIESRTPFSDDHKLIEYAMQLRSDLKIQQGMRKHILREAGKQYIPKSIYNRTDKIGFATPHNNWVACLAQDLKVSFSNEFTPFLNNKALNKDYLSFFSKKDLTENVHTFKYLAFNEWIKNQ